MEFIQLLHSFDCIHHGTGPNHNHGHTLDLVISKGLHILVDKIINTHISDNYCLVFFSNSNNCFLCAGLAGFINGNTGLEKKEQLLPRLSHMAVYDKPMVKYLGVILEF